MKEQTVPTRTRAYRGAATYRALGKDPSRKTLTRRLDWATEKEIALRRSQQTLGTCPGTNGRNTPITYNDQGTRRVSDSCTMPAAFTGYESRTADVRRFRSPVTVSKRQGICKQKATHRPLHTTVDTKTTKATNRRPSTNRRPRVPTFNIKMVRPNI